MILVHTVVSYARFRGLDVGYDHGISAGFGLTRDTMDTNTNAMLQLLRAIVGPVWSTEFYLD